MLHREVREFKCGSCRVVIWPKEAAIDLVHFLVLAHVGQLDVAGDDVSIIHSCLAKHVPDVPHRHTRLIDDAFRLNACLRIFIDLS